MRRIVYTRPDGGVSVIIPAPQCMAALTLGGGLVRPSRRDAEIAKFVASGLPEVTAAAWIDALIDGGKTDAEAYGLLRDKDVPADGMLPDVVDLSEIPEDRWFRDAWTRSPNGGPITISETRARAVQVRRILEAQAEAEQAVKTDVDAFLEGRSIPELDRGWIRARLDAARHLEEIRAVWPAWLARRTSAPDLRSTDNSRPRG